MKRLLAKAPDARFQSAADLLWALEQIDSSEERAEPPQVTPAFALRASTFRCALRRTRRRASRAADSRAWAEAGPSPAQPAWR